jgi:uncharacterized membrane protein YbhN (UPF0104 family)
MRADVQFRHRHLLSWLVGLGGLVVLCAYFQPSNFLATLRSVGLYGVVMWLALNMIARVLLVETTVRPVHALGFCLGRLDAFLIGWIRSFSNQILPLSGVAFYAHEIRRKVGISWSELAALFTPQFFLAALALGIIGVIATFLNIGVLGHLAMPMILAYVAVSGGALLFATKSDRLIESLPESFSRRANHAAMSFRKLANQPQLVLELSAFHCAVILVNGGRIWMLFAVTGTYFSWQEAMLLAAVAESTVLLQITPGALGLREGAVVAAAALLQVSPDVGAGVALIDRLFLVGTTTTLAGPAFVLMRRTQIAWE